jgi:hypothetical protein
LNTVFQIEEKNHGTQEKENLYLKSGFNLGEEQMIDEI